MQITFLTRKSALIYRRGLRQRVASLTLNCNGDFAIRAYCGQCVVVRWLCVTMRYSRVERAGPTLCTRRASELTECVEAWSRMGSSLLLPLPPRPLRPRLSATGVFFVGFTDIAFPLLVGMLNNSGVYRGARSSVRNDSSKGPGASIWKHSLG